MARTEGIHRVGAIIGTFQSNRQSLDPYTGTCSNSIPFGDNITTPLSFNEFVAHVVRGEGPAPQNGDVFRADAVPIRVDRASVGELAHLDVGASVAEHLDPFGTRRRMTAAFDDQIRTETSDGLSNCVDAGL